jgi:hypothetical protein
MQHSAAVKPNRREADVMAATQGLASYQPLARRGAGAFKSAGAVHYCHALSTRTPELLLRAPYPCRSAAALRAWPACSQMQGHPGPQRATEGCDPCRCSLERRHASVRVRVDSPPPLSHLSVGLRKSSVDTRIKHIAPELPRAWSKAHTTICIFLPRQLGVVQVYAENNWQGPAGGAGRRLWRAGGRVLPRGAGPHRLECSHQVEDRVWSALWTQWCARRCGGAILLVAARRCGRVWFDFLGAGVAAGAPGVRCRSRTLSPAYS